MKRSFAVAALLAGVLACAGCENGDDTADTFSEESYVESEDPADAAEEDQNETAAMEAVGKVWNTAADKLADGASWDLYYEADQVLGACNNWDFESKYSEYLNKAWYALTEQDAESTAAEAVQTCWDFPNGKLKDDATWDLFYTARDKLDACTDKNFTAQYEPAMTAIESCLRDRDAQNQATAETEESNNGANGGGVLLGEGNGAAVHSNGEENIWRSDTDDKNGDNANEFDPDDHDIEGYYEDHQDEFDDYEDAEDAFEDDPDEWDDY